MLTRRFFIGGAASCLALGPNRIFAAAAGAVVPDRPALTFGVISDVHIALAKGGKGFSQRYTTETLKATLARFRDAGVDAVVIAGDMAHHALGPELVAVGDAWREIFPGGCAPDGRKVERVFVTGNHDNGPSRAKKVLADAKALKENLIPADPAKWWDRAFGEPWESVFMKTVKGYAFVGAHWVIGDCRGKEEKFNLAFPDWYAKNGKSLDPSLPFFHVQHPHPKGTVHGPTVWGQDNGLSTKVLSAYPNAVAFSGHSHISLTDERSIWQGGFTSVGCGTLRNVSLTTPGNGDVPPGGYENGKTPKNVFAEADPVKAMGLPARFSCRQEQLVRVYADHVRFSRREAITGASYGPDLVMPLPAAERRPFDYKMREANALAPEFPAGAALTVRRAKGHVRGTAGARNRKVSVWEIVIPRPDALRTVRAATYDITATAADGTVKTFGVIDEGFRYPADSAQGAACAVCRIDCARLPKHFTLAVRAVSCWGRRSAPLEARV